MQPGKSIKSFSDTKPVQKEVQKSDLYLYILDRVRAGKSPYSVCDDLHWKKSRIMYYVKHLKKLDILENKGYGVWQLTEPFKNDPTEKIITYIREKERSTNESSSGVKAGNLADLHALNIKLPIIEGEINLKAIGGYEQQMNNWMKSYRKLPGLQATLQNNNNKSLNIHVWSRKIYDTLQIPALVHTYVMAVTQLMKNHAVLLDHMSFTVTTLHISIPDPVLDKIMNKGLKVEIALGRDAKKISEQDVTQQAKAWVDPSPFKCIETNDVEFWKNRIMMGEHMAQVANGMTCVQDGIQQTRAQVSQIAEQSATTGQTMTQIRASMADLSTTQTLHAEAISAVSQSLAIRDEGYMSFQKDVLNARSDLLSWQEQVLESSRSIHYTLNRLTFSVTSLVERIEQIESAQKGQFDPVGFLLASIECFEDVNSGPVQKLLQDLSPDERRRIRCHVGRLGW